VAERLAARRATRVLEVGLGTGLNLLATLDAALAGGAALHYRALELRPPPVAAVRALDHGRHLRRPDLADAWLAALADLAERGRTGTLHRVPDALLPPGTTLEVALGDATSDAAGTPSAAAAALLEPGWADAVYHDAFSPDASPELWSDAFLGACARTLAPGGAWVSYSVAGAVRRRLAGHGLRVEKRPGPAGGKREMLVALRPREAASDPTASPRR
jgi:tRNA U34 5-methylaminomethyl-2-thiouridine-forming methyltransferase MnmC